MNPTAKFARIFDLLSLRDPTLNATLYEEEEFGKLVTSIYATLYLQDAKEASDAPKVRTPEEQHFDKVWAESRARVAPLVKEALDAERWGSAAPRSSLTAPTELTEALDELIAAASDVGLRRPGGKPSTLEEVTQLILALGRARSKVKEVYKALLAENEQTRDVLTAEIRSLRRERDDAK